MNLISNPLKAYVRWRHSHGYGVHSPFAYNIVSMAVKPGEYGYYGYDDIDRVIVSPTFKGYPHARKDARLLLRLLVNLRSRRLILPPGLPLLCAAAQGSGIRFHQFKAKSIPAPQQGDFLVTTPGQPASDEIIKFMEAGIPVMAISPDPETISLLYKSCKKGLILHGTRIIVAIPRQEMAFVSYTMKF